MNQLKQLMIEAGLAVSKGEAMLAADLKVLEGMAYRKGMSQMAFHSALKNDLPSVKAILGVQAPIEDGKEAERAKAQIAADLEQKRLEDEALEVKRLADAAEAEAEAEAKRVADEAAAAAAALTAAQQPAVGADLPKEEQPAVPSTPAV